MSDRIDISNWQRLEPKVQSLWRVTNGITSLIFGLLFIPADFIARKVADNWKLFPFALPLIAVVLLGILTQIFVGKSYSCYRYQLGDDDLAVAKGVFWKSWRFVNRNRIQHVDLSSGPIARALGLVEVSIYVGGMQAAAVTIPGLSMSEGERLRATLVKAADAPGSMMVAGSPEIAPPPVAGGESPVE